MDMDLPIEIHGCYSQIVRNKLKISQNNYSNLAVSGMTCEEFYSAIQTDKYKKAIKSADVITVSIGSNELLGIAITAISNVTGVPANDPNFTQKAQKVFADANIFKKILLGRKLYDFFTSNETKATIEANIKKYQTSWNNSISYIKSINSNATIVATEFYNPYYEVGISSYDLGSYVAEYIERMNTILKNSSKSESLYKIAKIYDDFNVTNPRLTNVNINFSNFSKINVDPHPNKEGHSVIASRIMDVLQIETNKKIDIKNLSFSKIVDQNYTSKPITPSITIKDKTKTLTENVDYALTYINNTDVGEASIIIKGIGNYTGTVTKTFNIKSAGTNNKIDITKLSFTDVENQMYLGFKITPDIKVRNGNTTLKQNTDYTLKYYNNINVGKATIEIKGIGNYTGKKNISFTISPKSLEYVAVSEVSSQKYTGKKITPKLNITDGSTKLIENKDYTITYSNNVEVGSANATIKGTGNYTGELNKSFSIVKDETPSSYTDISTLNISNIQDKIYTGKLITPEVTIYDGSTLLKKDTDYQLSYKDNLDIGTGTLIIKGIGKYNNSIEKTFNITKKDIQYVQIEDIDYQNYTGKELKPTLYISSDHIKLKEGQDYTIEYSNNIEVGTAKIIIKGINNYTGTTIKSFEIIQNNTNNDNPQNNNNQNNSINTNIPTNKSEKIDNTITTNKQLPYTGIKYIILIILPFIIVFSVISIKKYNKHNFK